MKKKGFTLVELLAVIVILAIIALIAIPLIGNVIEKAKIGALESSVNGLIESANMYYANATIKGEILDDTIFDFEDGVQIGTKKLEYKGKVYNGKLILTSDSKVATCIDDGKYYAYKEKDSDEIISGVGTCVYDGTTGDFTIEGDTELLECENELEDIKEKLTGVTVEAKDVLKGKTFIGSNGEIITGTLVNEYTIEDMESLVAAGTLVSSKTFTAQSNQTAYTINNTSTDTNAKFVVYVQWNSGGGWGNRISIEFYGYTYAHLSNGLNSSAGKDYFGTLPYETTYKFVVGQNTGSGTIYLYQI